jgi:hypothetical protein
MWDGIRTRRRLHLHTFMLKQLADTEHVIGIADSDTSVQMVGAHDDGDSSGGLRGVGTRGFGDQIGFRDAAMHEVIAADSAFAEAGIGGEASGGNDYWGQTKVKEVEGMIEAGAKYGRRTAIVLGGTKNYDGVGGMQIVISGFADDVRADVNQGSDN